MRGYVVRKWPFRGRSRFVCWNITRVSLWLLCNVHFVQSTRTDKIIHAWYKQFTETGCLCKQKWCGRPLTAEDDDEQVWASFLHSLRKSTGTAATELSMLKTIVWRVLHKHLVLNVCNHIEYYETPCILPSCDMRHITLYQLRSDLICLSGYNQLKYY